MFIEIFHKPYFSLVISNINIMKDFEEKRKILKEKIILFIFVLQIH